MAGRFVNGPDGNLPCHKDDFGRVYDLEDPSPYFNALRPSGYRMPEVLAAALKAIHRAVCDARDAGGALRVLDFACGYGAVGALLRHGVSMPELYARYAERHWQRDDGRRYWEADAEFFAARRDGSGGFEIGGTDIAGVALEYAATMGFLDRTFRENLIDHAPSEALGQFLHAVDLVVESGSLGDLLPAAFERILDSGGARSPWFLYSPRPDVNWALLDTLWAARGYRAESLGTEPVRYRKPLGAREQRGHASRDPSAREAGRVGDAGRLPAGRHDAGQARSRCRQSPARAVARKLRLSCVPWSGRVELRSPRRGHTVRLDNAKEAWFPLCTHDR